MRTFTSTLAAMLLASSTATADAPADEWSAYVQRLDPIGAKVVTQMADKDDSLLRHEMYKQLFAAVSVAWMGLFLGDNDHPDFWPIFNAAHNFGVPNPDAAYYLAPLSDQGVYRISGYRGTVRLVDLQIGGGMFYPKGDGPLGQTYANYDLDQLHIGDNGYFEVVLSPEKPEGHTGDWWKLPAGSTHVLLRQLAYDWGAEVDARLAIERLDTPAIRPRLTEEELRENLNQIATWVENWASTTTRIAHSYEARGLVNRVATRDFGDMGGFLDDKQVYLEGQYELKPDEALILTLEVPETCRYWAMQLGQMVTWSTTDYINRQTSLNGHSATVDKDGKFRAVIASQDPGVPNWLDNAGYGKGTLFGRLLECSASHTPEAKIVKVADVRKHLPADTPVVTKDMRDKQLRARREGAQLRRRW